MKEPDEESSFSVRINNKKYTFACTDGEEHVQEMQKKLDSVISRLSKEDSNQLLSNYAIKMLLLLADEIVRENAINERWSIKLEQVVTPLIGELDRALDPQE